MCRFEKEHACSVSNCEMAKVGVKEQEEEDEGKLEMRSKYKWDQGLAFILS